MEYHPPLRFGVVAIEKGAFGSPSSEVANFTSIYIHIYIYTIIYIYIYIYIYIHTDCFIVSQLISVARHVARFYVRLSIIQLSHQLMYVSSGIKRHYVVDFTCLHFALPDTIVPNSYEELCITRKVAVIYSIIYIYHILEATPHKAPTIRLPAFHHENYPSKTNQTCRTLLEKQGELISDVLLWTPTYGRAKAGPPARIYIQQLWM